MSAIATNNLLTASRHRVNQLLDETRRHLHEDSACFVEETVHAVDLDLVELALQIGPAVFNGIKVRAYCWSLHHLDVVLPEPVGGQPRAVCCGVVLLECVMRMRLKEG